MHMLDRVGNFSKDVSDGENYTVLLNQLKPAECSRAPLQEHDKLKRAEQVRWFDQVIWKMNLMVCGRTGLAKCRPHRLQEIPHAYCDGSRQP